MLALLRRSCLSQAMSAQDPSLSLSHIASHVPTLLEWYDAHARALPWRMPPDVKRAGGRPDPYYVWLSEIMLQQTTVPVVGDYFRKFTTLWPAVADLAAADEDDVLAAWAGLGYYARARNLLKCARTVAEGGGTFPQTAAGLMTLPGIGPYTSAAIAAICYDEPAPVLDGNVERVLTRLLASPRPVRNIKTQLRAALGDIVPNRAGDFAQAMMDLGATICAPRKALCDRCPFERVCAAHAAGEELVYPVAEPKKPKPQKFGHAYVVLDANGNVLLQKRPAKGLLASMLQPPNSDWQDSRTDPDFPMVGSWTHCGSIRHVFTHFSLELEVWTLDGDGSQLPHDRKTAPHLLRDAAIPNLFLKVLAAADLLD